jgi:hypothetical protein
VSPSDVDYDIGCGNKAVLADADAGRRAWEHRASHRHTPPIQMSARRSTQPSRNWLSLSNSCYTQSRRGEHRANRNDMYVFIPLIAGSVEPCRPSVRAGFRQAPGKWAYRKLTGHEVAPAIKCENSGKTENGRTVRGNLSPRWSMRYTSPLPRNWAACAR